MWKYIVKRLLWLPVLLLAASLMTFTLGRFGPGDPVRVIMGNRYDEVGPGFPGREMNLREVQVGPVLTIGLLLEEQVDEPPGGRREGFLVVVRRNGALARFLPGTSFYRETGVEKVRNVSELFALSVGQLSLGKNLPLAFAQFLPEVPAQ